MGDGVPLAVPLAILRLVGVFPARRPGWALAAYRALLFSAVATCSALMAVQIAVAGTDDLVSLVRAVDMWTLFVAGLYKWLCMTADGGRFAVLTAPGGPPRPATARVVNVGVVCYMVAGYVSALSIILSSLTVHPEGGLTKFDYYNDPKSYPICCWIPFTVTSRWTFIAVFVGLCAASLILVAMFLATDMFFFGCIYAAGDQIDQLNSSIDDIRTYLDRIENPLCETESNEIAQYTKDQQIQCYAMLKKCVLQHTMILDYIKNIHKLFSSLIMVDYLHGIISLSFLLFQITINNDTSEAISTSLYIAMSVLHQFLNNIFGEFIIQKQLSVRWTVYRVPWWRCGKDVQRLLSLMILRSTTPVVISGFYMYKLSNQSFISFLKALYTYYMFLKQINDKQKIV